MSNETTNLIDLQLELLTTAYFLGDFSIIYQFTNKNSSIYNSLLTKNAVALKTYAQRNGIELDQFSDEQRQQFEQFQKHLAQNYQKQLEANPVPLPEPYFEELAQRAIELKNYSAAHSAMNAINKLEKKVNELIVKGVEALQSKEAKAESADHDDAIRQKIAQSADYFYQAIRIKNPLGNQFQYLSSNFFFKDHESLRKYYKYVELTLFKEIVDFAIEYLTDDNVISQKIITNLSTGKSRRLFLKYFAELFSLGQDNYLVFVDNYKKAVELLKAAKTEQEFFNVQKVLLGRGTGDNNYLQFLRDLAVEHPIATLLVTLAPSADQVLHLRPFMLKSGTSLLEFLELDRA
jgi:hypothetical protein